MSELEAKLGQARSDSKAQVKGHNTGKKELEASRAASLLACTAPAPLHSTCALVQTPLQAHMRSSDKYTR